METTNTFFPALNASLNATAAFFLFLGYYFVKKRNLQAHAKCMWTAFAVSAAFLASYLWYHFNYEANPFGGQGPIRIFYFVILVSHIILATLMVPFILWLMFLAVKQRFESHRRLARYVWPVWIYVSLTGVLVYFMLYQWFPTSKLQLEGIS